MKMVKDNRNGLSTSTTSCSDVTRAQTVCHRWHSAGVTAEKNNGQLSEEQAAAKCESKQRLVAELKELRQLRAAAEKTHVEMWIHDALWWDGIACMIKRNRLYSVDAANHCHKNIHPHTCTCNSSVVWYCKCCVYKDVFFMEAVNVYSWARLYMSDSKQSSTLQLN